MTALTDHCENIRGWLNYGSDVYTDALITQFTRGFEQIVSETMRCKHMLQIDTGTISAGRVFLPSDWQELTFVRLVNGPPLHFKTLDDFYAVDTDGNYNNAGNYTISGNYMIVDETTLVSPVMNVELHYYQDVPPLDVSPNWLMEQYPFLYTVGTLGVSGLHSFEEDRVAVWKAAAEEMIATINDNHKVSKVSGSMLVKRTATKGYG